MKNLNDFVEFCREWFSSLKAPVSFFKRAYEDYCEDMQYHHDVTM